MGMRLGAPIFMLLVLVGCGPMNRAAHDDATGPSYNLSQGTQSSQHQTFLVFISQTATLALGENHYSMRAVHDDLRLLSSLAKLKLSYWMPDMPEMGKGEEMAQLEPDGSYSVTLFFAMPGVWEVTLKLEDGDAQDDFVFKVQI